MKKIIIYDVLGLRCPRIAGNSHTVVVETNTIANGIVNKDEPIREMDIDELFLLGTRENAVIMNIHKLYDDLDKLH